MRGQGVIRVANLLSNLANLFTFDEVSILATPIPIPNITLFSLLSVRSFIVAGAKKLARTLYNSADAILQCCDWMIYAVIG